MADKDVPGVLASTPEDQRIAAGHFEYAHRAMNAGNLDLAIQMLRNCCRLVPANLSYRQTLRKVEKTKYKGNLRGSFLAPVTTTWTRMRLWRAHHRQEHRKVLELGEAILTRNPWDRDAHLCMAESAITLGMKLLAVWILQEGRERDGNDVQLNRALARLLEQEGHFPQAMHLWELVRKAVPTDREAMEKTKDLAATDTIARGNYEGAVGAASGDGPSALTGTQTTEAAATDTGRWPVLKDRARPEVDAIRARLEADPTRVDDYLQLSALLTRQGKLEEARGALQQGLGHTGNARPLQDALTNLEIEGYRRHLSQTEDQLRAAPNDEKLLALRGKIERKLNSLERDLYRRKVELDPADKAARFELGVRLFRGGRTDEAIPELQAARADNKLLWKALFYLGQCFLSRQNWPLARRNFEEALKNLPEQEMAIRKEVLFHLAQGHANAGDFPLAAELALDLANIDYSYRDIGRLLEGWQRQAQKAAASSRRG